MKIKKELQNANEKINAQILEEGRDVYDKLILENEFVDDKNEKIKFASSDNFRSKKLIWISSLCSVLIIVLTLSIMLPNLLKKEEPTRYFESNEKTVGMEIEDINSRLTNFQVNNIDFNCSCVKIIDDISGKVLYYKITLVSLQNEIDGSLNIVANKDFVFKERYEGDKISVPYKDYTLTYSVKFDDSDMLPMNYFFGCVEINDIEVYFDFSGFSEIFTTPTIFLDQVLIMQ